MKKLIMTAVAATLIATPASALTIKSGEVLTTNSEGEQVAVEFHESETTKAIVEQQGYHISGNNVAIAGLDATLTVSEALELVRNGLEDADLPEDVRETLQGLDDAQLQGIVELLNEGTVTVDDIQGALDYGCVPTDEECGYVPEGLQD